MTRALASSIALAAALACSPAIAGTFTLATIYEDTYFDKVSLGYDDAAAIVATGMPEAACVETSRLANAYGGFTACIPEREDRTPECIRADAAPTDANLSACYGPALEAAMHESAE